AAAAGGARLPPAPRPGRVAGVGGGPYRGVAGDGAPRAARRTLRLLPRAADAGPHRERAALLGLRGGNLGFLKQCSPPPPYGGGAGGGGGPRHAPMPGHARSSSHSLTNWMTNLR